MADEIYMAMAEKPVVTNIDQASAYIRTGDIHNPEVYNKTCLNLGRAINSAIAMNAVPSSSHIPQLLLIVEEVYSRKTELLQPSLISLMLPIKAACKLGWFQDEDKNRLLMMAKEVSNRYSNLDKLNIEPNYAHSCVTNIISRFYPRMKLEHILTSFDVKAGYGTFVADFHISLGTLPHHCQDLWLLVAKMDNMDTSACIVSPPNVYSFQINRKEMPKRTKDDMGEGPQLPSNVTEMIKYGVNLIEVSGEFDGQYIVALAYMNFISSPDIPQLQDYASPVSDEDDSDCEVSGILSRVSLDCPLSQHRIKIPVKGHLCKHTQCFDYNNFMEMNSTKPIWKCPVCNNPVCNLDIRIDQDLLKILNDVANDVSDVIISEDGSWMVAMSQTNTPNTSQNNTIKSNDEGTSQDLRDSRPQNNDVPEKPNPSPHQTTQPADSVHTPLSVQQTRHHVNLTQVSRDSLLQSQDSSDTIHTPPLVEQTIPHQPSTHEPAPSQPHQGQTTSTVKCVVQEMVHAPVNSTTTTTTTEPTPTQPGDLSSTSNKAQRTSMFSPVQLTPCATTSPHYTPQEAEQPHYTGPSQSQSQPKVGNGRKRGRPRKVPLSPIGVPESERMRGSLQGKNREAALLEYTTPPRQHSLVNQPWSIPIPTIPIQVALLQPNPQNASNPCNLPH